MTTLYFAYASLRASIAVGQGRVPPIFGLGHYHDSVPPFSAIMDPVPVGPAGGLEHIKTLKHKLLRIKIEFLKDET